ncbi:NADH-quinone oxidoreductase subunit NuoK [Salinisphaera japonica]|uniref:NADH-quinone oxidoreductase subunit NuoK n=1 Tax=Salinisphaera japonica TaxID=1304270 RepID=UPI000F4BB6B8|nr:NADH-quinone oxidoreductase subunit NuoK [Salinisphaera japonica]|tara:strand:+ start:1222 stop:1530 length:309 start_codon:yes stop_codon:yes gene_type:complete
MNELSMVYGMGLAALLFLLGFIGVVIRRNTLFVLMCLEIMINAAGLAFIVAGARWSSPDGNTMFILIIAVAAAEAAIGLGLLLQLQKRFRTIDIDAASEMHG